MDRLLSLYWHRFFMEVVGFSLQALATAGTRQGEAKRGNLAMATLALDSILIIFVTLAEAFMLWVLWNLIRQSMRRTSRHAVQNVTHTFAAEGMDRQNPTRYFGLASAAGASASSPASSTRTAEPGRTSKLTGSFPVR
jgi:hypothetical protein